MKKRFTKFISLILACICICSFASACGGPGNNPDGPKEGTTVIQVHNFDGGIGSVWIKEAAARFAELKKDEVYMEGTTGVSFAWTLNMDTSTANFANSSAAIRFLERTPDIQALAQNGDLLDITDIVTDTNRVGGSLESNIFESALGGLKLNGKYYALPHYDYYGGLSYNRLVFDELKAYFARPDTANKVNISSKYGAADFVTTLDDNAKSAGPDGIYGTQDDGLPASLEEFVILMNYIKVRNCAPVMLSGQFPNMSNYLLAGLWPALAGKQQMINYYNGTGEIEVVKLNADGSIKLTNENIFPGISYIKKPETETITLDGSDTSDINRMVAKYYAVAMLEIIENEGFFSSDYNTESIDHFGAQKCLIYNGISPAYKKCAMLIDGSYWYCETSEEGVLDMYEQLPGNIGREQLDVRVMVLPTSYYKLESVKTEGGNTVPVEKQIVLSDGGEAYGYINANVRTKEPTGQLERACKEFLAFLYSEQELKNFTICTSVTRPVSCKLNSSELSLLPKFTQKLLELRDNEQGTNIVYKSGTTDFYLRNRSTLEVQLECPSFTISRPLFAYHFLGLLKAYKNMSNGVHEYGTAFIIEQGI